jgi:histidyl-tRNA synthetase
VARLPRQFKFADRMGIRVAVVLGPDEAAQGQATVKDLVTGAQQSLPTAEILPAIRLLLDRNAAS